MAEKQRALTILQVARQSGISQAVISKLERNQTQAELEPLFRLAGVFNRTATDLIRLVESCTAQIGSAEGCRNSGVDFSRISVSNAKCMTARATAGQQLVKSDVHHNKRETCRVLEGKTEISLPREKHQLIAGQSIQFDAAHISASSSKTANCF